ncbi:hypothetical protein ABT256_25660 [Amycolatopsis japonica]|uniref:hypothetical protein n=1 Tax=Amycolatopsis japonica TaxID=208439 RepID=UPI00331BFF77
MTVAMPGQPASVRSVPAAARWTTRGVKPEGDADLLCDQGAGLEALDQRRPGEDQVGAAFADRAHHRREQEARRVPDELAGDIRDFVEGMDGSQPGDPAKAAWEELSRSTAL